MKGSEVSQKQTIFTTLLGAITASALSLVLSPVSFAFERSMQDGVNAARGTDQVTSLFGAAGVFTTITNVMLFLIGAISVIMIIIGGLRYVISGGNPNAVTGAKNTILYAVVGIMVAIFAYAIINFVIGSFSGGGAGGGTNV